MITTNAFQRVFCISIGDSIGTCFTIEVGGKQYIITAKHVAEKIGEEVRIFHDNQWKTINMDLIGHCEDEIDISVLTSKIQLSPVYDLQPTMAGLVWGQDVYFLGFPYGMSGEMGEFNRAFPLPFVKKAIVSCVNFKKGSIVCYLDGHNNPGFSGGPVVFKEPNKNNYKVASVISGFRYEMEPIYDKENNAMSLGYKYNTGIIVSYGIKHAIDLIIKNPIGYKITKN
ncbi:MAG: trypsin-like peptidase domain-containing protein [Deltaproteobacteria bacterium]|nr:trypsin-like peptidase domain-containing protein [Deltaproteobacteria bacterium]